MARACKEAAAQTTAEHHQRLRTAARRIMECARSFRARIVTEPGEASRIAISHPSSCSHPLCSLCNRRKAARNRAVFSEVLAIARESHPTAPLLFFTSTIRNRPLSELRQQLADLDAAHQRFMRLAPVKRAWLGMITSIEIVIRRRHGLAEAGAHLHSIVVPMAEYLSKDHDYYLSQPVLTDLWRRSLGPIDYRPIVYINRVRGPDGSTDAASVNRAVREVLKYAVKPASLFKRTEFGLTADPAEVAILAQEMFRRRTVRATGLFAKASRTKNKRARARQKEVADDLAAIPF